MAGFKYEAVDAATGGDRKGVIEADTPRQARAWLRENGMVALALEPLAEAAAAPQARRFGRRGLSAVQLGQVTRQFAVLLEAGLTIEHALNALIEQAESEGERDVLAAVRSDILAGHALARALEKHPDSFPEIYRTMVSAGEQSGRLNEVLLRLADYLEARRALRQKIGLALIYPAIISVVALLVVLALLAFVVPQVVAVFRDTHQMLPLLTRALLASSDALRVYGVYLLGLAALAFLGFRRALRYPDFRFRLHHALLRLPLLGRLLRAVNTARLASTLAILVGSGVPLLTALRAGAGVVGSLPMRRALEEAAQRVAEGGSLSRALAREKIFPPLFVHLVASGEASGRLQQMFERAAAQQTQELEGRAAVLTGVLEPALILAMGGMVLLIVLAILLPVFEMNQLVK